MRRRRFASALILATTAAASGAYASNGDDDDSAPPPAALVRLISSAPRLRPLSAAPLQLAARRRSPLPGNVLIADKGNNRLLIVSPQRRVIWRFPNPGDLRPGQTFRVPDDAFFTPDGGHIVATQEDDDVISVIDVAKHRIVYRYGTSDIPGVGRNLLDHPDDAMMLPDGRLLSADIVNCRVITIRPPQLTVQRQLGETGTCLHDPPLSYGSPNGAFPTSDRGTVITEINGDWVDVLDRSGRLEATTQVPSFSYPSDTNEVRPGLLLSADYATPGAIETFDPQGHVRWRYAPGGGTALDHPSLALPLPNGDVLANDDFNDRVIVIDPRTNRVVWQYGKRGRPGSAPGLLDIPDGVDLAPPYSLVMRFPRMTAPATGR